MVDLEKPRREMTNYIMDLVQNDEVPIQHFIIVAHRKYGWTAKKTRKHLEELQNEMHLIIVNGNQISKP